MSVTSLLHNFRWFSFNMLVFILLYVQIYALEAESSRQAKNSRCLHYLLSCHGRHGDGRDRTETGHPNAVTVTASELETEQGAAYMSDRDPDEKKIITQIRLFLL